MAINLLDSTRLTLDASNPNRVHAHIGDEWQIMFTQGGIVMSTLLRAATLVLGRPDLRLATMAATFVAPVPAGPVVVDVEVLRSGKGGAQVHAELRTDPNGGPNSVVTAVFTNVDPQMPRHREVAIPEALTRVPTEDMIARYPDTGVAFLQQTEWIPADTKPDEAGRSWTWFRFLDSPVDADGTWDRAAIMVPGDQLGGAVDSAIGFGTAFCVSLQISAQFYNNARGEWIALDSTVWEIADGIATGFVNVWDSEGTLVANVTQTAKLRTNW